MKTKIPRETLLLSGNLRAWIETANAAYQDAAPIFSDQEFDTKMQQLRQLEQDYPDLVTPDSPTQRVLQKPIPGFQQVRHLNPMLSLANVTNDREISTFLKRLEAVSSPELILEPKVDGLSVELRYGPDGVLFQALTRGDGKIGDDVTAQVRTIRQIPLGLPTGSSLPNIRVRGEVYMSRATFDRLNQERADVGEDPWANPRNAAAGALKLLDPRETAKRCLSFVGYEIFGCDITRQELIHDLFRKFQIPTFERNSLAYGLRGLDRINAALQHLNSMRSQLPFDIDGAVLKLNERSDQLELGMSTHSPNWAVAFKYPPEEATTTLLGVTVQMGKHGSLTPVAELQPVRLAGSTISRATLHNYLDVARKGIMIGDQVVICKAAEIIPTLVRFVEEGRAARKLTKIEVPQKCPFCGHPTTSGQEDERVVVRCTNYRCHEWAQRRLEYFVSKQALDVDGMGPAAVQHLYGHGHLLTCADLFDHDSDALHHFGFGDKKADNLAASLAQARHRATQEQDRVIRGLCIPNVGQKASKALFDHFGSIYAAEQASREDLANCPDLLPVAADAWFEACRSHFVEATIHSLIQVGFDFPQIEKQQVTDTLKGEAWCITGTLTVERDIMAAILKSHGARVVSGVTSKTTHLLVGEKAGSKLTKAESLGIPVVTEVEIRKRLGIPT